MMGCNRREFVKAMGLTSLGLLSSGVVNAGELGESVGTEFFGVLVDTTLCIGCMQCEKACARRTISPFPRFPAWKMRRRGRPSLLRQEKPIRII